MKAVRPARRRSASGEVGQLPTGGLNHFAQAEAAQREIRRQPRAGAGRRQGRRDAAPVLAAALVQEGVEHRQPGAAPTRLAVGRLGGGSPRASAVGAARRARAAGEADGLRRRQAGLGNEGFPALVPGVAVGEPADHPELGELLPLHAPAAAPAAHRDVALEARPVAGLLVGIQRVEGLGRWRRSNTSTASPVSTCSRPPSSRRAGTGRAGSRAGSRSAGARRRGRPTGWARRCRRTAAARAGRR
jgi:hypothetical protein